MSPQAKAHLLKYETARGTLLAYISVLLRGRDGRDPVALSWIDLGVKVIIVFTGASYSFDGPSSE